MPPPSPMFHGADPRIDPCGMPVLTQRQAKEKREFLRDKVRFLPLQCAHYNCPAHRAEGVFNLQQSKYISELPGDRSTGRRAGYLM